MTTPPEGAPALRRQKVTPAFDPATGDWIEPAAPEPDPAAPRRGLLPTIMWVLLILDMLVFGWLLISSMESGAVLAFMPDSERAEELRGQLASSNPQDVALNSIASLVIFGIIPLAWVLGTRRKAWAGTKKYLQLGGGWKYVGKAALLTLPILAAVIAFISLYVLATEGVAGLKDGGQQSNPAVDSLLQNMTIPLALLISFSAGFGEEIMFRGILQRRVGIWGQAVLFGLAHSVGGYLPQILFAFALAVGFGYLYKRGWPLWALMITHFLYDFILLGAAALGADL